MSIDYSAVRWILCDLGKTLVNFDHQLVAEKLLEYLKANRVESSRSATSTDLYHFFFRDQSGEQVRNVLLECGTRDMDWLAEEIAGEFGVSISIEMLERFWNDIFLDTNPRVIEAMRTARERGVHVAICSNTTRAHWEFVLRTYPEVADIHERAFLSFELGAMKTQPGFFEQIVAATAAAPHEHLFIDDLRENLDAAALLGIQTIHFQGGLPPSPLWD